MSEPYSPPYPDRGSERVLEELLRAAEEIEVREREQYLPLSMVPDPRVRSAVLMLARKYADMTENFAQSLARRAEDYGVMMVTANLEKPTNDGVILVIKFQIIGVRGDVLKSRYQALKRIAKSVKGYKSSNRFSESGEINEPNEGEPRGGSPDYRDTSAYSEEDKGKSHSEKDYGAGHSIDGNSEALGGILTGW